MRSIKKWIPLSIKKRFNSWRFKQEHTQETFATFNDPYGCTIKIAVPSDSDPYKWGDFHFAVEIQKAFWRREIPCRIDTKPKWVCPSQVNHFVLSLRGCSGYIPTREEQRNSVLWVISHPSEVSSEEEESFGHVVKAYREGNSYGYLPQASGFVRPLEDRYRYSIPLFVGRNASYRRIKDDCLSQGIAVYSPSTYIPYSKLNWLYEEHEIVLNDQCFDMSKKGIVANRVYDALACGAKVLTTPIKGIQEQPYLRVYNKREDIPAILEDLRRAPFPPYMKENSFDARVESLLRRVYPEWGCFPSVEGINL